MSSDGCSTPNVGPGGTSLYEGNKESGRKDVLTNALDLSDTLKKKGKRR
jgi:hypothetical protein